MKIALVHDYLCGVGGSERVFQYMCEAFPEADAYTLALNRQRTLPCYSNMEIRTTWLNPFVRSASAFKFLFPVATYVMERLDLRNYDVVLSSSATVAKYVKAPNGRHICYCYIPTRAIWHFDAYFGRSAVGDVFKRLLPYLRRRDLWAAAGVDEFIAISAATRDYIREYYGRDSRILHSPIDLSAFAPGGERSDAFLLVSRLEHWKRVDYAIEAFNRLRYPLRIVGLGPEEGRLRDLAGPTISFLGGVDDATLAREYAQARAVIFTPYLEYGLIPLEANASGTPVIAYGKGGICETMIPANRHDVEPSTATAVFFDEQSPEALVEAIQVFERLDFDPERLVRHASQWGVPEFQAKLRVVVGL